MPASKHRTPHLRTLPAPEVSAQPKAAPPLKVYLTSEERITFETEAATHRQSASGYARFILESRADPLLFLQLCKLRDPAFAQHLMGNPNDAGRVIELEKTLAELSSRADLSERDRVDAMKRAEEAERRLQECQERAHELSGQVVELHRIQQANRERMMQTGQPYEESPPTPTAQIVAVLTVAPRLLRKELEARLIEGGMSQQEASNAIAAAARASLIQRGKDARYHLPAEEASE